MVTTAGVPLSFSLPWPASARWIYSRLRSVQQLRPQIQRTSRAANTRRYHPAARSSYGVTTPLPDRPCAGLSQSPFRLETGYALCAKRPSRPFPPPFLSPPSSSFSDPLTTHSLQDKRLSVQGELIRGLNNGDDAIIVTENFLGVDDGIERRICTDTTTLEPIEYLQSAYEATIQATSGPTEWYGTTTSATAILHWRCGQDGAKKPLLYVTNLGDCKVLVIRPSEEKILFRTKEQWHWFDCPMQLGTNSVDTPRNDAVMNEVDIQEEDIVLALSDGVMDNLWEHEVLKIIMDSLEKYDAGKANWKSSETPPDLSNDRMVYAAKELLNAALTIAQDPFAESPFMEKGMEEGLPIEGGKLISCQSVFSGRETDCIGTGKMDDISVIVGACKRRDG
ncbi:hypothetical protein N7468_004282 [Penicillium chermesinum]|uniref:Protein phosphatase n=1 Tax=Penicillium chermesinum TaxID=63820 RepID=A0A9W9TT18_9EURO|nr:uncharacterized protein N7468_004282 [Penicillium chermesinum]KAJ5239663.1 hypothetical protein N7468_004282 [Penicillium chermesinum]